MPAHPKPAPKARSTHAMRSAPKKAPVITQDDAPELTAANIEGAQVVAGGKVVRKATRTITGKKATKQPPVAKAPKGGGTKSDLVLGMLKKPGGASSKEMEAATGWAPHSVRGFLGTLRKKGVTVISKKFAKGEPTVYSIEAPAPVGDVV